LRRSDVRTLSSAKRHGAKYLRRLFTAAEIQDGEKRRDAAGFFARRFAAKEACAKAVCTENLSSGVVVVKSAKDGV
jgi:phosphopantetheine--protein transferase-like protein